MHEQIVTLIALGEIGGMQVLSVDSFLSQFQQSWQSLILRGCSIYIDSSGQALAPAEALIRLQAALGISALQSASNRKDFTFSDRADRKNSVILRRRVEQFFFGSGHSITKGQTGL